MSEHENMPAEQMFTTKQLVEAMTRTTCENDCGNCNVYHLSVALAYEKFMRRGDVKHINECLESSLRKVRRVETEVDRLNRAITRVLVLIAPETQKVHPMFPERYFREADIRAALEGES